MPDYVGAAIEADPEKDAEHHGVKGQRWGVRRSSSQLRAAAKQRGDSPEKKPESSGSSTAPKKPAGDIQDKVESSSERYARLAGQARAGQASAMSEQDLKFFNARTEALSKINKLNETKPGWLKETTTKVIQQSAQRQMQMIADSLADKYIGDPLKKSILGEAASVAAAAKGEVSKKAQTKTDDPVEASVKAAATSTTPTTTKATTSVADRVAESIASSKRAKGDKQYAETQKKIEEIDAQKAKDPSLMNMTESLRYYKDNPTENPTPPSGLSPNSYRIWLDEIRRARGN